MEVILISVIGYSKKSCDLIKKIFSHMKKKECSLTLGDFYLVYLDIEDEMISQQLHSMCRDLSIG